MITVGLLHPGQMGAVLGGELTRAGQARVIWASQNRSDDSRRRAEIANLEDVGTLDNLGRGADVVLSVCPPDQAEAVAAAMAATSFSGVYVDANAVSPATSRSIEPRFSRYVDGGIVGPPPTVAGATRLYLAGEGSGPVAALFTGTNVDVRCIDGGPGAASALKMCFAAWTKGTSALLLAIRALAEAEGVASDLLGEWATSMPDLGPRSERTAGLVGPKAWRFVGEMEQISATFTDAGLPGGFHQGAAEVYDALRPLKASNAPTLADALRLLRADPTSVAKQI